MYDECVKVEWKGKCCCSCKYQMVAFCHPDNKSVGKGRVTTIIGYLCAAPDFSTPSGDKSAVFFEGKHGLCEMFEIQESVIRFKNGTSIKFSGDSEDKWVGI